ncbi:MAG TPA: Lrp/AsnC family transcriptional regulator [Methanomicrobia archaeon]|nr:Lrp/AsnC family transcriptional regulator [Methanomicrobia archaeon]
MADELDLKILRELQKNSRIPFRDLAKMFNVSAQTISDRVNKMVKNGIIRKFTIDCDLTKLGYSLTFFVQVDTEISRLKKVANEMEKYSELYSIHIATGEHDIIGIGVAKDTDHLYEIIENKISQIEGAEKTITFVSLKKIKDVEKISVVTK